MSNLTIRINDNIASFQRRYDAENDVMPGAPRVTFIEYQLLEMIKDLVLVIDDLQDQVDKLNRFWGGK
jgi:hypothetical protein